MGDVGVSTAGDSGLSGGAIATGLGEAGGFGAGDDKVGVLEGWGDRADPVSADCD